VAKIFMKPSQHDVSPFHQLPSLKQLD